MKQIYGHNKAVYLELFTKKIRDNFFILLGGKRIKINYKKEKN